MIRVTHHNGVIAYKMGRSLGPYVPYMTHAFQIGRTLIDTGTRFAEREFLGTLASPVDTIINTHHHEDHIGNNSAVQEKFGSAIIAHPLALSYISDPVIIPLKPYQKAVWGRPLPSKAAPAGDSINTGDCRFQVIHCTGHCDDHICLYEHDRKWLFSGDMFCGIRNIYLRKDETFPKQLESLRKLAALDIDVIFCAMKGVVTGRKHALTEKIDFMEKLRDAAIEMNRKGKSVKEITRRLLGFEDMMWAITMGHFSKKNLIESIIGSPV